MGYRIGFVLVLAVAALPVCIGGQTPDSTSKPPQDDTPVFRSGVEAVRFDAIVTDKKGKPITDLTIDDFEVEEDGAPQTVEQFSRVVLPPPQPHQPAVTRVRSDVSVNDESQKRLYVIVLGDMSWPLAVRSAKIVRRFFDEYFDDGDQAALVPLDRGSSLHFTNDRRLLMGQMDAFVARMQNPDPFEHLPNRDRVGPLNFEQFRARERERVIEERATFFGDIATTLSHVEAQRKSILYLAGQLGIDPYDAIDMPKSSFTEDARAMMEPILAGNLSVYPIYPGGVTGPLSSRTMRALAYVSGGAPSGSDITRALTQIVRDNSAYYVLGYQSTNPRRDGGFRRIHVTVRRKGAKVRARSGYFVEFPPETNPYKLFSFNGRRPPRRPFVPPSDLPPALTAAMNSPVVVTDVPMKVFAAAHKTTSRNAAVSVVVEIPASGLDLQRTDGEVKGQLDLAIGATSGLRSIRGTGFTYNVDLRGEALEQFEKNGLRVAAEIPLEPGDYHLGVAAGAHGGRTGKVLYDLTVPDFDKPLLAMSSLSLTSTTAAAMVTLQAAPALQGLPGPVSVSRTFDRSDTPVLYTEVYENIWWTDAAHGITLTTELRGADGTVIPVATERRASRTPQLKGGGHPFTTRIPLTDVRPGPYVLHVEASSDFDKPRSVSQEVPIEVRELSMRTLRP
jgi:VWFA-related protein